jgi:nucleoid-associated protein YejK
VDDDATPRTLSEVKAAVQRRKESTAKSLGVEILFTKTNTLPQDHPAVTQLAKWAGDTAGLTVTFPAEKP